MSSDGLRKKDMWRRCIAAAKTREAYEWRHEPVFFHGSLDDIVRRMHDQCVLEDDGFYHYYGRNGRTSDSSIRT